MIRARREGNHGWRAGVRDVRVIHVRRAGNRGGESRRGGGGRPGARGIRGGRGWQGQSTLDP
jgi:hypothetical protein